MNTRAAIRQVHDTRGRKAFIDLAFRLYRGDPNWVPPLRRDLGRLLAARTAFFERAEMALFLAERDGRAVGRIAAIHNRAHNATHNDRVGFFGFFECDPADRQAAAGLFQAAEDWLARRGLTAMRGPVNPSMNAECGLLIEGFERPPMVMMPYNPPAYMELYEAAGLGKCKDLYAYLIRDRDVDEGAAGRDRMARMAEAIRRKHPELHVRTLDMKHYEREVLQLVEVFEAARGENWGHVPLTEKEVLEMARQMKPVVDPDLVIVAEIAGRPAGASMALPNINRGLKAANGRMFPLGFLRFLRAMRRNHEIRIFGIAALERYRHLGIAGLLMLETILRGRAKGIDVGEASWVLEDNTMSNRTLEKVLKPVRYKTYRIYEKPLAPEAAADGTGT